MTLRLAAVGLLDRLDGVVAALVAAAAARGAARESMLPQRAALDHDDIAVVGSLERHVAADPCVAVRHWDPLALSPPPQEASPQPLVFPHAQQQAPASAYHGESLLLPSQDDSPLPFQQLQLVSPVVAVAECVPFELVPRL